MPAQKDNLKDRLSRRREIKLNVTGRKSGQPISNPVWFVFDDDQIGLLPVQGAFVVKPATVEFRTQPRER